MKKIHEIRILPPFAIGRLGSGAEPVANFSLEEDPEQPLDFHRFKPERTLVVDEATGEIARAIDPPPSRNIPIQNRKTGVIRWVAPRPKIGFKENLGDENEHIRPVAPFLEVWARTSEEQWEPLTTALLEANGLTSADVSWQVTVANRKVARRTGNPQDEVKARTPRFSTHDAQRLDGRCPNFISPRKAIDFGRVRYIKPNAAFPEIRLRFTPAQGLIYGPKRTDKDLLATYGDDPERHLFFLPPDQQVYKAVGGWKKGTYHSKGGWVGFQVTDPKKGEAKPRTWADLEKLKARETLPPSLYAIVPPGPCWLHDNVAVSRGFFDDTCDGFVEVKLPLRGKSLEAAARICSGPPAMIPDTFFLRTLADDLDQVIFGPWVPPGETDAQMRERALDIIRRAFDTVRFLNVAVMNGNPVRGRDPLLFDTMPAEEAFDVERLMRPVVPPRTADTLAIMQLHQQVYAALRAGAAPWFARVLRLPTEVADYTDHGRRKMPAMMCGADGSYLALTYRQINAILAASGLEQKPATKKTIAARAANKSRQLVARNRQRDLHHVAVGNPVNTRPESSIGNCTPGLEVDFRAVWRRVFEGVVLREWDNLVMEMEPTDDGKKLRTVQGRKINTLVGHRLLRVEGDDMQTQMIGPSPADTYTRSVVLATQKNPFGVAPLEWSNALARLLHVSTGRLVTCYFTKEPVWSNQPVWTSAADAWAVRMRVRPFFEDGTAVISRALAKPGELTQGLCSPWQNDYRECSCYYWASARPDFVNVVPTEAGASAGDNWMQKTRTGDYVPDDYVDTRVFDYDDLFNHWETCLKFQIEGKDEAGPPPLPEEYVIPTDIPTDLAPPIENATPITPVARNPSQLL